jgi:hypothetical protein
VIAQIHGFSDPGAEPVPWSVGLERVAAADTFWLSTVRPDGRPRVTPLIAVWHGDAVWFSTGPEERKAKNLGGNPACILTTGSSDLAEGALDAVLEGVAEQVTNDAGLRPVAEAFGRKYGTQTWDYVVRDGAFAHRSLGAVRWCSGYGLSGAWGFARATPSARRHGVLRVKLVREIAAAGAGGDRRAGRLGR